MSTMIVSTSNDTRKVTWDPDDVEAVARVKEEFARLVESNLVYKEEEGGRKTQVRQFNPAVETYYVSSPLRGG